MTIIDVAKPYLEGGLAVVVGMWACVLPGPLGVSLGVIAACAALKCIVTTSCLDKHQLKNAG